MPVIIEPAIEVENIELEINENDEDGAKNVMNTFGPTMPVIKINDYILSAGEVKNFNLKVGFNKLPTFYLTVNDDNFNIRRALKKEVVDKTVIFIGNETWYLKFNGIILNIPSEAGDAQLDIFGSFYNDKLYESIQKSYNNLSLQDTLKDICSLTKMGLFAINNNSLSKVLEYNLNTNKKHLHYFNWLINNYSNNLWSVDTFGYFHVSDIESLRKQPLDKFTIFDGKKYPEKDMIITTDIHYENENKDKFLVEYYTINSNIGEVYINNNQKYTVESAGLNPIKKQLKTIETIGISEDSKNTFDRFVDTFNPFYKDIINKDIGGKVISVTMRDLIYEITPFSIINLEVFLPKQEGVDKKLDTENSGNKIVISYEFDFTNKTDEEQFPKIRQKIDLI